MNLNVVILRAGWQAEADIVDVVVVGDLARHTARWLGKGCRVSVRIACQPHCPPRVGPGPCRAELADRCVTQLGRAAG
jgi:hypothetical protein